MNMIPKNHPIWKKLIMGEVNPPLLFLGAKIAIGHLRLKAKTGMGGYTPEKAIDELYAIYEKSAHLPNAAKDLELLSTL